MVMENSDEKSCKLDKESHKKRQGKSVTAVTSKKRPKKQARPKKKILNRSVAKERSARKVEGEQDAAVGLPVTDDDRKPGNDDDEEEEDVEEEDEEEELEEDVKKPIAIETKARRILQKELSLSEKVRLIKEHRDHKKSLRILASEFNIGKSTVSGILKRRDSIQKEHDATHNAADRCRKKRHTETELINDLVWKWYQITKGKDTPLSGPKIKTKARDYASDLGYDKFKASNGWLDTFKKTHGIRLPVLKIYGAVRELRNGGQRARRPKPIEGNKRRQRQVAPGVELLHNNSQWDTGTQNSGASLHIPQIFEPEILLQTRGSQGHNHQQGYSHPQQQQQQQQQQQHHHQHHQQQQQSLPVPQPQHPTVPQQVMTTQWANSSPDFQQPPPPQQQQQQQQQQQAPQQHGGGSNSQAPSASNGSQQGTGGSGSVGVDNSPQQMMNNLSGMYNYAMSKNDHSLANQVLHLKAAFEASIIHDRFATTRRQSNNGSYFW